MIKVISIMIAGVLAVGVYAETTLVFGFDNNSEPNGIQYQAGDLNITFSGAVSETGQTDFNTLDGVSAAVGFFIGDVNDLSGFSGTLTPLGGSFYMGASGGGLTSSGDSSNYFDDPTEGWMFTFSSDVTLEAVNYYAPDSGQQRILTNGTAVAGSPFSDDYSGSLFLKAGDTLTFGYDSGGAGSYGLDDFTVTVVPEPVTLLLIAFGGVAALVIRRMSHP